MTQKLDRRWAIDTGSATYVGAHCKRDQSHGNRRYTSSGGCCQCVKASSAASKAVIRTKRNESQIRDNLKQSLGVTCGR